MLGSCFGCVAGVWNCCVLLCIVCSLCLIGYCLRVVNSCAYLSVAFPVVCALLAIGV